MFYCSGTVIVVVAIVLLVFALFIPGAGELFVGALGTIGTAIGSLIWGLLCMIGKGIGSLIWGILCMIGRGIGSIFSSLFAGIGDGISALFSGVGDGLTAIFQAILLPVLILVGVGCLIWMIRRTFF